MKMRRDTHIFLSPVDLIAVAQAMVCRQFQLMPRPPHYLDQFNFTTIYFCLFIYTSQL